MALAVKASTEACATVTRGMAKIGIDSRSPMASAAITFSMKFGASTTPVKANFGWRSASNTPQ